MLSKVVHTAPEFEKEVRKLKRKYPHVSAQVRELVLLLMTGELPGDRVRDSIVPTYKVRLPNPSARRGKSGGFRVYYSAPGADAIYLVTIYAKTETNDVSLFEVQQRIKQIGESARKKDSGEC